MRRFLNVSMDRPDCSNQPISLEAEPAIKPATLGGCVWAHAAVLILIAIAVTYPCLRWGVPNGHSVGTHVYYQHFFDESIAQGDWYPRWITSMNQGLGSGIFFAQYPLPYYVAWGVSKVVPNHWGPYRETRLLGISLALAAILAALSTYAWCATFTDRLTALLAAIIYLSLPYFLTIDLYMRAALGEFWALAFVPLSFFFIERMAAGSARAVPALAVAFALTVVSHLFTAVLLGPVLLLYSVSRVERRWRGRMVGYTLVGLVLAMGLAGVYAVPFWFHSHFFHPENFMLVQGGNASPLSQMFSYNTASFPRGGPGWLHLALAARFIAVAIAVYIGVVWFSSRKKLASLPRLVLALVGISILVRAAFAGYVLSSGEVPGALPLSAELTEQRAEIFVYTFLTFEAALACYWSIRASRSRKLADLLIVLAIASYVMMTSWSQSVWKVFHFLWNIQFPWRLNTLLMAATVGLAALAISDLRRASRRRALIGAIVALGLWGVVAGQSARLGAMIPAFRSEESYPYKDKTVATSGKFRVTTTMDPALPIYAQADPKQALLVKPQDDEKVHVMLVRGSGVGSVTSVQQRSIELEVDCQTDCAFQIGQFYYPAWQVTAGPTDAELHTGYPGGLMELSLSAGEHHVRLEVPHGWSEWLGLAMSACCLLLVSVFAVTGVPSRIVRATYGR